MIINRSGLCEYNLRFFQTMPYGQPEGGMVKWEKGSWIEDDFHTIYRTEVDAVMKKLFGIMICLLLLCSTTMAKGDENMAKLLYQGHGSLRITTVEGKVIYVDPYAGEGYELPADLILVSHGHSDPRRTHELTDHQTYYKSITKRIFHP